MVDAKQKTNIKQKKRRSEIQQNVPLYDVRLASEGFSNIAAIIAGFAFAAIILVIQTPVPLGEESSRDWATVAFIVAFIGCLLSAFTFSIIKGEESLTHRAYTMALLCGCGFTTSANLVFFGLATISKVFLSTQIYAFIYFSFPLFMAFSLVYVCFSAFDPIVSFEKRKVERSEYAQVFGPPYILLIAALVFKYMGFHAMETEISHWFNWVMAGALFINMFSAIAVILITMKDSKYHFSMIANGLWVGFHATVIALLFLLI